MPLGTLKISQSDFKRILLDGKDIKEVSADFCNRALGIIIKHLRIPDENDVEMLVVLKDEGDKTGSEFVSSFTCGAAEYPDFTDEIFDPKPELIQEACDEIQKEGEDSLFDIKSTTMEAWKGTTFSIISPEDEGSDPLIIEEDLGKAKVSITLSPELSEGISNGSKEKGAANKENLFGKLGNEILDLIPDRGEAEISGSFMADTEVGVTVDLPDVKSVSRETRESISEGVKKILKEKAEGKSATVWVRPGGPEVYKSVISK